MKKLWLLSLIFMVSVMLSSCQYIMGDFRETTDAKKPGLFLEIQLQPIDERQSLLSGSDMEHIKSVMERRVNSLGVATPRITIKGQIMQIEMPGYTNLEEAKSVIGKTGELLFTDETGGVIVSGKNLKNSEFVYQRASEGGVREPVVQLTFDEIGTKQFAEGTKANIGKTIMITLDENVLMTPKVNKVITDGTVIISFGRGSNQETVATAKEMATVLKGGSIPAKVVILKAELR